MAVTRYRSQLAVLLLTGCERKDHGSPRQAKPDTDWPGGDAVPRLLKSGTATDRGCARFQTACKKLEPLSSYGILHLNLTTSVEQASGAANVVVEHTIHSSCSLSRALPQTYTCPAVAGHSSVAATAAAVNVTSS